MQSHEIHPGDIIAGKYRVRAILGRNHGLLVDAFHTEFDQRVVVKALLAGSGEPKEIERFRREARTLAKLSSEHVARIIDVGSEGDGSFYLVREYLEGTDLARYVRTQGPLALADAVLLILQAAEAVAETHSHGIIVREIQPSTLFLTTRAGGAPLVKLIDFGTAKLMSAAAAPGVGGELTATAMFGLSPYSSPEMIRKAKSADGRTDVWSLGAILYELMTGRPPFAGEAAMLMLQITREEPAPPSHLAPHLPAEIDQIIAWALAKDPDARFKNVYAFAHALRPFAPPEGQLLVDRIGQISEAAKRRPVSLPAPAPPPRGSQQGSVPPPRGSQPAPPARPSQPAPADYQHAPLDADYPDETTSRVAPGMLAAPKPHVPTIPPPRGSAPGRADPYAAASAPGGVPAPPALPSAPPPAPLAAPSSPPPSGFASSAAPSSRAGAPVSAKPNGPSTALAPAEKKPDRRLAVGAIAAAAVLLPALVAILVMSFRSRGGDSGAASTGAVSVPLPASATAAVVVPTTTAEVPPPATVAAITTAEPTATSTAAPAEDPSKKGVVSGGSSGSSGSGGSKPTVGASDPTPKPTSKPADPPPASGGATGTLMAVALGGSCAFSVNGSSKGSGSSIKVTLPPGTYSVMCKPAGGAIKSKSIQVKAGSTAMATFKL